MLLALLPTSAAVAAADMQSLVDVARKEAARRQKLAQMGVKEKRIDVSDPSQLVSGGAISVFSLESSRAGAQTPAQKAEPRGSLRSYQSRLEKLDRDIAQAEERIKLLRIRVDAERWAPTRIAKGLRGSGSSSSQEQLGWQILELEAKLAGLRKDRSDAFQAGRKAGYLPGELEGRGFVRHRP